VHRAAVGGVMCIAQRFAEKKKTVSFLMATGASSDLHVRTDHI
jgi:hypothetical protein